MSLTFRPHKLSKLSQLLTNGHVFPPYEFDDTLPDVVDLKRLVYNCRRGELSAPNNDVIKFYGEPLQVLTTRIAITRFVMEDQGNNMDGAQSTWAIESLSYTFSQTEYIARAMLSGIDMNVVQLSPETKAEIQTWQQNKHLPCPTMLASLMKAIAWGVDIHAGFNALVDHIYTHLLPAFKVALESFHRKWRYDKERGLREETQRRWCVQHNPPSNENHIAEFARKLNSFKFTSFRRSFGCLKESLPPQISFDSNGALQQPFLALSYLGFAVLDCFLRKSIDSASPLYRSSLSGGANYGMNLKQTVLCDQSLSLIADKLSICDFAPDCTHQTKAQVLSAAVGQLWLDHPQTVEGTLLVPLGQLVTLGHNVICQISPWLLPKMPSQTPCSVVPPPYDNYSSSAPPIPPTNQDRPSPSLQSIASKSMSRQAKSVVSKAVKSITKPLQRITSGSTSNIASLSSDASVISSANPSAEPAIEAVTKSRSKGFLSSLKAQSRSSSSASQAESSATRRLPPADKKPVSQATLRARLMKSAQDAAESTKAPRLTLKKMV
ncbi:hypothetical protein ONZ45_g12716 [Pleurotus djamor]|nr:hypothetical protein ONZ45_g12716 [Pleurotus djamor]